MLQPWCKRDIRSSGMLRSVDWYLITDVSVQIIRPIFKRQAAELPRWRR